VTGRHSILIKRGVGAFASAIRRDARERWLGRVLPPDPTLLQLRVNDVCDSRCTMCNIWQHVPGEDLSPQSLRGVLADPLFRAVQRVEIGGGEPTLRADLPEIGQALVAALPRLNEVKLLTNALQPATVITRVTALAGALQPAGVPLEVCVALDGIGDTHDRNRGINGSFEAAVAVLDALIDAGPQTGAQPSIRCTLTPITCYDADDVLLWGEQRGIAKIAFQVALDAARYDNRGYTQQNPFSDEQRFHLAMFFDMLVNRRKLDLAQRMYYKSLVDQLAFDRSRRATCMWQARGVTLGARGDLSFCPVQSAIVGSAVEQSARRVFTAGIPERQRILREHCDTCQFDQYGPPSTGELARRAAQVAQALYRARSTARALPSPDAVPAVYPADHATPNMWRRVLITGWYGTETTGDKAILAEVLHFLKTHAPDCDITLTTLDRKVSDQTERELADLCGSHLVDIARGHDPALIEQMDAVIMGGGPLMETQAMENVWRIFAEANRQRKARIIFGCGVGPFHTDHIRDITGSVIRMATAGFFRDQESHAAAETLVPEHTLAYACDPALAYLSRWRTQHTPVGRSDAAPLQIATLLRANTREFATRGSLTQANEQAARQIAQILEAVCDDMPAAANLFAMNAHWLGGDDRLFNRQVAACFERPAYVTVAREYAPLDRVAQQVVESDAAVAMRYHGHLFSIALGIPFLSIDYTGRGGKVASLMRRIGYDQWSEDWRSLDQERAIGRLKQLIDERAHWSEYLLQRAARLVSDLEKVYVNDFKLLDPATNR